MATIEIKVPDLGGSKDVPVIELLAKPGDSIAKDQGLLTLESDKATMELPSSAAGVLKEFTVKVGDEVSEGMVIAVLEAEGADAAPSLTAAPAAATTPAPPAPASAASAKAEPAKAAPAAPASSAPSMTRWS